jgi:uncharacterized OB-fold protein
LNLTIGGKKKKDEPPPAKKEPVERRCSVCGNYTTSDWEYCPKCRSRR